MAENSKIEWTDHTFNPWVGCTKVSPGCDHCYAEAWSKRSGLVRWGNHPRRRTGEAYWRNPHIWNRRAPEWQKDQRQRVFCASLADVFDNQVDRSWRQDLYSLIRECSKLDWLILTKRPENIAKMLPADWGRGYSNVWLGTTAEDQQRFDARWRRLSEVPAAVRFVSYEPAVGAVRLSDNLAIVPNWIIAGGESGARPRAMDPQWARDLLKDSRNRGVAFFFKQWGSYKSNPLVSERGFSVAEAKVRDPHAKGGSLLDGDIVREFPAVARSLTEAA